MRIRGAAAIGSAAARTLATHAVRQRGSLAEVQASVEAAARLLLAARPTAVTLRHGVEVVRRAVAAARTSAEAKQEARAAAASFVQATDDSRAAIAAAGASLVRDGHTILTHCHSGTAMACLTEAWRRGTRFEVIATETRPFRQGLLTSRALAKAGVPVTLVVDAAVEHVLATRDVDHVLVGADTVSEEGHLLNKIGTAGVAALAGIHDVPFRSAAGFHKFSLLPAAATPVEERAGSEVARGRDLARGVRVANPVFDRTDAEDVSAYVTEDGLAPPRRAVAAAAGRLRRLGL